MARTKGSIEIEGIYGTEVLGSFSIIRGFATLQELARISVPVLMNEPDKEGAVTGHQRPLDEVHAEEVKKYFEQGDQRFVPEVILSLRVPLSPEMLTPVGNFAPTQIGVSYSSGGMVLRRKHKGKTLQNHVLRIGIASLPQLKSEQRIRRIDGNHRLAKAEELKAVDGQVNRYKVPFCLLLLGDVDEPAHDYTEALVFHTINSTAKALDGELALKLILGQKADYTPAPHQEFAFAPALHLTRLLDEGLRGLPEPFGTRLGGRPLARLSIASKELLRSYPEKAATLEALTAFSEEILGALAEISTGLHGEFPDFCGADYFIELAGHVWMKSNSADLDDMRLAQTVNYLRDMVCWMGPDGMRGLSTGQPLGRQLIKIYDEVVSRVPKKVFLARWYLGVNHGAERQRAAHRYEAIKQLVEGEMKMQLVDLANKDGGTYQIHQTMFEQIRISDIFIADLTGLRPNVMIELGYALRDHQPDGRLLLIFNAIQDAEEVPFDTKTFRYERIGEAADIPSALRKHLHAILDDAKAGKI